MICRYLQFDRTSLSRLCLTHRSWIPSARVWLFNHITITHRDSRKAFENTFQTSADIGAYIHSLDVIGRKIPVERRKRLLNAISSTSRVGEIVALLPPSTALRSLSLHSIAWNDIDFGCRYRIYLSACTITQLSLQDTAFECCDSIMYTLSTFTSLTRLRLENCTINSIQEFKEAMFHHPAPPISHLAVEPYTARCMIFWISRVHPLSTITTVEILSTMLSPRSLDIVALLTIWDGDIDGIATVAIQELHSTIKHITIEPRCDMLVSRGKHSLHVHSYILG